MNVADNPRFFYCVCPMWKSFNLSLTEMLIHFLINVLLLLLLLLLFITFVQGIKNYIPETYYVSRVYSVAVVLWLQFVGTCNAIFH
jgi:hypothetical protein